MFSPTSLHAKQCFQHDSHPVFLTDQTTLIHKAQRLIQSFSKNVHFYYAMKANYNPSIIKCLKKSGIEGVDTVSPFEILWAKKLGYHSKDIIFTGCASSDEELKFVHSEGVLINVGSISELKRYAKLFPGSKISLRLNPGFGDGENKKVVTAGIDSKFGILKHLHQEAFDICKKSHLNISGLHLHLGSGLYSSDSLKKALDYMLPIAKTLNNTLNFIDLGGGFGVQHNDTHKIISLNDFSNCLSKSLKEHTIENIEVRFEPGKYLVAESTALLCKINLIKNIQGTQLLILNTGFNHLLRPALYESYHKVINISSEKNHKKVMTRIEGNLCESGDIFCETELFPESKENDVLAILSAGAYGSSMSSLYNFKPFAREAILNTEGNITFNRKKLNFDETLKCMGYV